jgi:hypothetical protein
MVLRVFRDHCEPLLRNSPGARDLNKARAASKPPTLIQQENSMNRKMILVGLAAVSLAASAAPASAQGFTVGVGFGDGWYGGPSVGVGFGTPGWGYDDWRYGSYAAAPCTCGTYRSARIAPRYRYSSYAYDNDYAYYPYDDYYYGGNSYASVGFGWSDDGWRGRRFRDRDRFSREDRVRVSTRDFSNRDFRNGREEFRDRRGMSRASVRTSETRTMTRGGGEIRGGGNAEFRGGANAEVRGGGNAEFRGGANAGARGDMGGSMGRGGGNATIGAGGNGRRGGDNR